MYYISFKEDGTLAGYGNLKMNDCISFEIDHETYKLASTAKATIENGKVTGFTVDESCVLDEETQTIVNKGETISEKVDSLLEQEIQNAEYMVELDYRLSVMELNGGIK